MKYYAWSWADAPAILLAAVRAATVTAGAVLIRGGLPWQAFAVLGVAVAGLALVIERQLTERLNQPLQPRQSILALLACWAPTFITAVSFSALTAFAVIAPAVGKREVETSFSEYWRAESQKVSAWTLNLRTATNRVVEGKQREVEAEQARIAAARRERIPYSTAVLAGLRRELVSARNVAQKAATLEPLPLAAPVDHVNAADILGATFRSLIDIYVPVSGLLTAVPEPPAPTAFQAPVVDLPTLFMHETAARNGSATVGWAIALLLEELSFIALWRGGQRVPLAARVREWWRRAADLKDAILRRNLPVALPIMLEPMGLAGAIYLNVSPDFTLSDCMPRLRDTLSKHPDIGAARNVLSITGAGGKALDEHAPLMQQLAGSRLVITLEAV